MTDWGLALSALGTIGALGMLVRASIRDLSDHLDRRFSEAESRRAEASAAWTARLAERDRAMERVAQEQRDIQSALESVRLGLDTHRGHVGDTYVSREQFLEATGAIRLTLEKLSERMAHLTHPQD